MVGLRRRDETSAGARSTIRKVVKQGLKTGYNEHPAMAGPFRALRLPCGSL
jgi:hypothetical protein